MVSRIICKESVRFRYFNPKLGTVLDLAREVWDSYGIEECVVTSLNDSTHSRTSLHYAGCAVDLRNRNIPERQRGAILQDLRARLGAEYDVVDEENHVHVEWQPKHA